MKKETLKQIGLFVGIATLLLIAMTIYIKSSDGGYRTTHIAAVERIEGADGRTPVGNDAYVKVEMSTNDAYKATKGFGRTVGYGILIFVAILLALAKAEYFERNGISTAKSFRNAVWLLLIAGFVLVLAPFGVVFSGNWVEVTPETFDAYKDNLGELFKNKTLIR